MKNTLIEGRDGLNSKVHKKPMSQKRLTKIMQKKERKDKKVKL